jgi:hypothetical protein
LKRMVDRLSISIFLGETNITMENHHFSWENSLFLWPFSIANCQITIGWNSTWNKVVLQLWSH